MIGVQILGDAKVLLGFTKRRTGKALQAAIKRATLEGALMIQKRAREKIMRGPKGGRKYKYGKGGKRTHQASAPGEPPANWTGNLARSIKVTKVSSSGPITTAQVTADAPYALALEFGTRRAGKDHNIEIEARPFLRPSLQELAPAINALIAAAVLEGQEADHA